MLKFMDTTAIEEVRKILDQLPPDATYENIQYHIYVREKVAKGLDDVNKGRLIDESEADKRMSKWFEK